MCVVVIVLLSLTMLISNVAMYDEITDYWDTNNDGENGDYIEKMLEEKPVLHKNISSSRKLVEGENDYYYFESSKSKSRKHVGRISDNYFELNQVIDNNTTTTDIVPFDSDNDSNDYSATLTPSDSNVDSPDNPNFPDNAQPNQYPNYNQPDQYPNHPQPNHNLPDQYPNHPLPNQKPNQIPNPKPNQRPDYPNPNQYPDDKDNQGPDYPPEEYSEEKGQELDYFKGKQCVHGKRSIYGCYNCYCVGGQLLVCTSERCPFINEFQGKKRTKRPRNMNRKCKVGRPIPSPDSCNDCRCEYGEVVCTTKACGPVVAVEHRHCPVHTWHPLENPKCKECYCIDGESSFCFLNFCGTKFVEITNIVPLIGGQQMLSGRRVGQCDPGQYFTLGTIHTCQGCVCTKLNKWKCWSIKGACASYYKKECPPGTTLLNTQSPCSICYCGIDGTNMCATDESCAHNMRKFMGKQGFCDSINCWEYCKTTKKGNYIGICLKTGCTCAS